MHLDLEVPGAGCAAHSTFYSGLNTFGIGIGIGIGIRDRVGYCTWTLSGAHVGSLTGVVMGNGK